MHLRIRNFQSLPTREILCQFKSSPETQYILHPLLSSDEQFPRITGTGNFTDQWLDFECQNCPKSVFLPGSNWKTEIVSDFLLQFICYCPLSHRQFCNPITEGVLLVGNSTEKKWFQPLWDFVICFTDHPIRFYNHMDIVGKQPTHGSAFVYFGKRADKFAKSFRQFGKVVVQWSEAEVNQ